MLALFDAAVSGAYPLGGLTLAEDGGFYGTTTYGGAGGAGSIFRLDKSGTITVLRALTDSDGIMVEGELLLTGGQDLYGASSRGGTGGGGAVFRFNLASRQLTILHSFSTTDGLYPRSGLVRDSAGTMYGTTYRGGASYINFDAEGYGTLYRIDPFGNFSLLHQFNPQQNSGGAPAGVLALTEDGSLYGTTSVGGAFKAGTVYELTATGGSTAGGGSPPVSLPAVPSATPALPTLPNAVASPSEPPPQSSAAQDFVASPLTEDYLPVADATPTVASRGGAPTAKALKSTAKQRRAAVVAYNVQDDGGITQESINVHRKGRLITSILTPFHAAPADGLSRARLPRKLKRGSYSFCVEARDLEGLTGQASCAALLVR